MKKGYWLIILICIQLTISYSTVAFSFTPDIIIQSGNEKYNMSATLPFSSITSSPTSVIFNSTGFYVAATNDINISIVYINNDITNAITGESVLEFNASTSAGSVYFNISGFKSGTQYNVIRNGAEIATPTSNSTGYITFTNNVWSGQEIEIITYIPTSSSAASGAMNWTYIMENFMEWCMQGYVGILGAFVWPIIFVAIIGYVYIKQQSAVAAAIATLMLSVVMISSNFIMKISPLMQFLQIMVCLVLAGLMVYWIARRRR